MENSPIRTSRWSNRFFEGLTESWLGRIDGTGTSEPALFEWTADELKDCFLNVQNWENELKDINFAWREALFLSNHFSEESAVIAEELTEILPTNLPGIRAILPVLVCGYIDKRRRAEGQFGDSIRDKVVGATFRDKEAIKKINKGRFLPQAPANKYFRSENYKRWSLQNIQEKGMPPLGMLVLFLHLLRYCEKKGCNVTLSFLAFEKCTGYCHMVFGEMPIALEALKTLSFDNDPCKDVIMTDIENLLDDVDAEMWAVSDEVIELTREILGEAFDENDSCISPQIEPNGVPLWIFVFIRGFLQDMYHNEMGIEYDPDLSSKEERREWLRKILQETDDLEIFRP